MALADGYKIFMPNLPQAVYHFTNYWNGFLEGFTFDPGAAPRRCSTKNQGRLRTGRRDVYRARDRHARSTQRSACLWASPAGTCTPILCVPPAGPGRTCRLDEVRPDGIDCDAGSVPEAGGKFYPANFRVDGARLPV